MPIGVVVASVDDNEKKHAPNLLGKVGSLFDGVKVVVGC
jgi:hypothetical protein